MRAALPALLVAPTMGWPSAQPTFRSGTELVTVPVTVKHKDTARAVPDITAADLRVFESGTEQRIDFVERDTRPLSLALVLDVSSSMVGLSREWAALAMVAVFERLLPTDEVSLVVFGGWAITPIPWSPVATLPGLGWAQWVMSPETQGRRQKAQARSPKPGAQRPRTGHPRDIAASFSFAFCL